MAIPLYAFVNDAELRPGPMNFADVLHPAHGANYPSNIVRDRDHPQLCTMAIGSPTKFLHDLSQFQIIARDQSSALIEARFVRRRRIGPVRAEIHFRERILLAQLTQS